jgi:hypothetical protein
MFDRVWDSRAPKEYVEKGTGCPDEFRMFGMLVV